MAEEPVEQVAAAIEQRASTVGEEIGDEGELMAELLESYRARAPEFLAHLGEAREQGGWDQLATEAHKLKGVAANLGLARVAGACEELMDAAGHHGQSEIDPPRADRLLATVRTEHAYADQAIEAVLASGATHPG